MARLQVLDTGEPLDLTIRHLVGRSRKCLLHLRETNVSSTHAELSWDGEHWRIRDLGSRNGTYVDGRRLAPGELVRLAPGTGLGFGSVTPSHRLLDLDAPRLLAFGPGGTHIADEHGVLCLPDPESCEGMVLRDHERRWVFENEAGTQLLEHEDVVVVDGARYEIHLPTIAAETRDVGEPLCSVSPSEDVLEFRVSRDGEHVDLTVHHEGKSVQLQPRAHLFVLLELARVRLADVAQAHLGPPDHGWIYREDLLRMLGIDSALLNLWVFRARQQFAQAKLAVTERLIERREGARQLRIGVAFLRIH